MSPQNQSKSTFTLRISDGGGTFRCQATSTGAAGTYPRAVLDITDIKQSTRGQHQSASSASQQGTSKAPSSASRLLTSQSNSVGTFRINS
ncbi:MAG: hypothetical protein JWM57_2561, partial [Phycisphaerales bacterium]|nr:hypothetical protein [Phycisphaerales bacterium]